MKIATRNVVAHRGGQTRRFVRGDVIPEEWEESVTNPDAYEEGPAPAGEPNDDTPAPEPTLEGFPGAGATVVDLLAWVDAGDTPQARLDRARYALEIEEGAQKRAKALTGLADRVAALEAAVDVLDDGPEE